MAIGRSTDGPTTQKIGFTDDKCDRADGPVALSQTETYRFWEGSCVQKSGHKSAVLLTIPNY